MQESQLNLFDNPPRPKEPPAPPHYGRATSQDAAALIGPHASWLRRAVYQFLLPQGPNGATDEEIQHGLDMPADTERPRRRELVQAGLVRDSGEVRRTTSGREAIVWVTTDGLTPLNSEK